MTGTLLGEWGFLDNLEDTSGNARHGSANFTPSYIDGPQPGTRALRFSGTGQTINYGRTGLEPVAASGGVITMAWVKLFASHSNFTDIFHKTLSFDSTRHSIDIDGNSVFLMSRWRDQVNFTTVSSRNLTDLGWHHICNVDSDDRYAWIWDGDVLATGNRSANAPVNWESFNWLSGANTDMSNTDSSVNVAMTGIRMFSGTMTDSEIADWRDTPIVPIETGRSGRPKVWDGSDWIPCPAKVWNGSEWVEAPMAGFDGTEWVPSK